jgi:hypothetical protein
MGNCTGGNNCMDFFETILTEVIAIIRNMNSNSHDNIDEHVYINRITNKTND